MTELSPAAQAVKKAALACNFRRLAWPLDMPVVAAALRAAADQVVPIRSQTSHADDFEHGAWFARDNVRDEILAIAAELEGQP
jgi:hypothetical protein